MGSVLTIPRSSLACRVVVRLASVIWSRRRAFVLAFFALSSCCIAFVERLSAQEAPAAEPQKPEGVDDVYASPFGLANNIGLHVIGQGGRYGELDCQLDGRSAGCRIAELNCLMHPEIQSELELTDEQKRMLKPVFEQAAEVIWFARWERGSKCESIKKASLQKIQALAKKLDEQGFVRQVLLPSQFERLLQIERRFVFNIHASLQAAMRRGHSDQFFKMLRMDRQQVRNLGETLNKSVSEIRADNANWDNDFLLPLLQEMLTGEAREEVDGLRKDVKLFSDQPAVRYAQMSPLFLFAEIERFPSRDASVLEDPEKLDLTFSVFEPVIMINGRFAGREDFILRERLGSHPKWRNFLFQLKGNGNKWLELSDDQSRTFDGLLWLEPPREEGGVTELRHFGDDRLELLRMKWFEAKDISVDDYRRLEKEFLALRAQIDEEIGERVKEALLSFQRERLQFALGASQLHQLGIWHVLRYEMLGSLFRLKPELLGKLEEEITKRRKQELERLVEFEKEMLQSLTTEQREAFTDVFGEPVPHLSTMTFTFLGERQAK